MKRLIGWAAALLAFAALAVLAGTPTADLVVASNPARPAAVHANQLAPFNPIVNLSNSPRSSEDPAITADQFGNLYVIWNENFPATRGVNESVLFTQFRSAPSNQIVATATAVSDDAGFAVRPRIAVDRATLQLHAAWGRDAVFYATRPPGSGGVWNLNLFSSVDGSFPDLAVDQDGRATNRAGAVNLVYETVSPNAGHIEFQAFNANGTGVLPPQFIDGPSPGASTRPAIAIDGFGTTHVVWSDATLPDQTAIYYTFKLAGRSFQDQNVVNISNIRCAIASEPRIAADGTGRLHIVFSLAYPAQPFPGCEGVPPSYAEIMYITRPPGGSFSPPVNISHLPGNSDQPALAISPDNVPYVAFRESNSQSQGQIFLTYLRSDGTWAPPTPIENVGGMSAHPAIAFDNGGNLHVVWQNNALGQNAEILYTNTVPPPTPTPTPTSTATATPTPTPTPTPALAVSPTGLLFVFAPGETSPQRQTVTIANQTAGVLTWSATPSNVSWLTASPSGGTAQPGLPGTLAVDVDPTRLPGPGTTTAQIVVTAAGAGNSPQVVPVKVCVGPRSQCLPFRQDFAIVRRAASE